MNPSNDASPPEPRAALRAFAYRARLADGQTLCGTVDAADVEQARQHLQSLQLQIDELAPAAASIADAKPIRGEDFLAINQQLAHLATAGLPLEHGLRLIAQDLGRGRLAQSVREVAAELERGTPLPQAFAAHAGQFPPMYGPLVAAGIKANNLPGMLLGLGRHLEMVQRLRSAVWRAFSYPLMVLLALAGVVIFLGFYVLPEFQTVLSGFHTGLPWLTRILMAAGRAMPAILIAVAAVVLLFPLLWRRLTSRRLDGAAIDYLVLPLPLIGPVLKKNMIARWCDAAKLAVDGGLDLPAAIKLAGEAIGSPRLSADGRALIDALHAGRSVADLRPGRVLPATVSGAIGVAVRQDQLSTTLESLSRMYQDQAELRLGLIPALLTPILLLLVATVIAMAIMGTFSPMIEVITSVSGRGP